MNAINKQKQRTAEAVKCDRAVSHASVGRAVNEWTEEAERLLS